MFEPTILANYRDKTEYYNLLEKFSGNQISSEEFCSSINTKCCMPMEVDLHSLIDVETTVVLMRPLVLVGTKIFQKSEGINAIEDFYVPHFGACLRASSFNQANSQKGHKKC